MRTFPRPLLNSGLDAAIVTTALNPGGVAPWTRSISELPTQAEVQALATRADGLGAARVK